MRQLLGLEPRFFVAEGCLGLAGCRGQFHAAAAFLVDVGGDALAGLGTGGAGEIGFVPSFFALSASLSGAQVRKRLKCEK